MCECSCLSSKSRTTAERSFSCRTQSEPVFPSTLRYKPSCNSYSSVSFHTHTSIYFHHYIHNLNTYIFSLLSTCNRLTSVWKYMNNVLLLIDLSMYLIRIQRQSINVFLYIKTLRLMLRAQEVRVCTAICLYYLSFSFMFTLNHRT